MGVFPGGPNNTCRVADDVIVASSPLPPGAKGILNVTWFPIENGIVPEFDLEALILCCRVTDVPATLYSILNLYPNG